MSEAIEKTSLPLDTPSSDVDEKHTSSPTSHGSQSNASEIGKAENGARDSDESHNVDMSDDGSSDEVPMRKAGFAELFRYATKMDLFFNFVGLLTACVAGAAQVSHKIHNCSQSKG